MIKINQILQAYSKLNLTELKRKLNSLSSYWTYSNIEWALNKVMQNKKYIDPYFRRRDKKVCLLKLIINQISQTN